MVGNLPYTVARRSSCSRNRRLHCGERAESSAARRASAVAPVSLCANWETLRTVSESGSVLTHRMRFPAASSPSLMPCQVAPTRPLARKRFEKLGDPILIASLAHGSRG